MGEGDSGGHMLRETGTREEPGTLTQGAPVLMMMSFIVLSETKPSLLLYSIYLFGLGIRYYGQEIKHM